MHITVLICTRNRAEQLRRTLEAATAIETPGTSWELLVIDNGSSDHTPEVVESFAERLPIRRVSEPQAGLSNARNRGVAEANGSYICWTDDDVLIDPHWLSAYAGAFAHHPEAAYFGGPIELVLEEPTPSWFRENRELLGPSLRISVPTAPIMLCERMFSAPTFTTPISASRQRNVGWGRRLRYSPPFTKAAVSAGGFRMHACVTSFRYNGRRLSIWLNTGERPARHRHI